jgi:hypothetical protein
VADIYGSTEEIKARGQVIIGLMHKSIGHLGIFVSGKVAKKEHTQIVSVLEAIEAFPPGLYGMEIEERKNTNGHTEYDVSFREHRLEDVAAQFNRFARVDELPFKAVEQVSEFNQRAYELFAQPFVQAWSNEATAALLREFHPLRAQRWMFSDLNPWLAWLGPAANAVRAARGAPDGKPGGKAQSKQDGKPAGVAAAANPLRDAERRGAELVSASLDFYRALRDAATESIFFGLYGNLFSAYAANRERPRDAPALPAVDPRELPFVKDALAAVKQGGYAEAVARIACLLARHGEPLPLARLALRKELAHEYADYLPVLEYDAWRRMRGEQEIIVRYARDESLATLPLLLDDEGDRKRLLALLERLERDDRVQGLAPNAEQLAMVEQVRALLPVKAGRSQRPPAASVH